MNLQEILADVNLLVPNSISDEIKVRWLNQVQRQMYRDYAFPDTSRLFRTEGGKSLYSLPDDCERDRIISVVVNNAVYEYRNADQDVIGNCYSLIEGNLWLYPTPIGRVDAYINYRPTPRDMRVEMQDVKPDFPEDFHELLVYGVSSRVAKAEQQYELARVFEVNFAELELNAKRKLRKSRQKHIITSRSWR